MVSALSGLSAEEKERVSAAVADVQARSEAHLAMVVVPESDRYQLYPVLWGATLAVLIFGLITLFYPDMNVRFAFMLFTLVFLSLSLLLEWRPLRMRLAPRRVRHAHARVLAHREFAVHILSHPEYRGGVLFFVSLAERYAEVIADHKLHQAAGQAAWDRIVADFAAAAAQGRLADGFISGARACGALLEQHHPKN